MPFAPARTASGSVETVGKVSSRSSAVVSMRSPTRSARTAVFSPSTGKLGASIGSGSAGTSVWGAISSIAKNFCSNEGCEAGKLAQPAQGWLRPQTEEAAQKRRYASGWGMRSNIGDDLGFRMKVRKPMIGQGVLPELGVSSHIYT